MADTHEFWSHGTTVVAQNTPHLTGHDNGLFMMPLSWGTVVRQNGGTTNWFHIPIVTPLVVDDWRPYANNAYIKIRLGNDAHIDVISVRETSDFGTYNLISNHEIFGNERESELRYIAMPDRKIRGPVCISLSASFDEGGSAEDREILFAGAGMSFEEKA